MQWCARHRRRAPGVALVTALLALCLIAGPASARRVDRALIRDSHALAAQSPQIPAAMTCAQLGQDPSFVSIPHYPTAITTKDVAAAGGNPAYCDVTGMIAPQTQFELKLPDTTWQGRYLQEGCGGYCGTVSPLAFPSCDATLGGDFAMATDNEGHTGGPGGLGSGCLFAFNSQKLRTVYGYESEHALAVVAKTIIAAYYGRGPEYSYYNGCSDGGREAMEMAERYPTDFNGIIAGAPEMIAGPLNAEAQTWFYKVNTDANGDAILTDNKLAPLHAAVIAACGGDDGTNDGIITDPQTCAPKLNQILQSVTCPETTYTPCLTPAQVQVARLFYQGPADPQGRLLYPGGAPLGSELGWAVFELPPSFSGGSVPTTRSLDYFGLSLPYLRFQLLAPGQLGPDPSQWQFTDQGFRSMFPVANIWDAMSTNLWAFRAHGGKLIMWQGWADNGIPPTGTVDYYDTLAQRMGGLSSTQQFARLFMFPTVYHCGGGYGNVSATNLDLTQQIVDWVEGNSAPTQVNTTYTIGSQAPVTRPVYPYPAIPQYNGSGADPTVASSFHPVVAAPYAQHSDYTNWIGNYLFYEPLGGGYGYGHGHDHRTRRARRA